MMPSKSTVYRDGAPTKVDAHELVPGDLVQLKLGDRCAAPCGGARADFGGQQGAWAAR